MKTHLAALTTAVMLVLNSFPVSAQQTPASITQSQGLTVELVTRLLDAGVPTEKVIEVIQNTQSDFNLSLADLNNLRNARVPDQVLDAMMRARRNVSALGANQPQPRPQPQPSNPGSGMPLPGGINPTPVNPVVGSSGGNTTATNPGTTTVVVTTAPQVPPHSAVRLSQAKAVNTSPLQLIEPAAENCPADQTVVKLDFENGSPSVPRLNRSGKYCFTLVNFNPLYTYSINAKVTSPSGDALALLNSAIESLKGLATGTPTTGGSPVVGAGATTPPTPSPDKSLTPSACTVGLTTALGEVRAKADNLRLLLTAVVPNRNSDKYVAFQETSLTWKPVPQAFEDFEKALRSLQRALPDVDNKQQCDPDLLAQAEAVLIDEYPPLRENYRLLATKITYPRVTPDQIEVESVDTVAINVTSSFESTPVKTNAYRLDSSFGILSSSAGFLVTRLPARSYTSVTAPNPADPTMTQNVLRVDNNDGLRTALTVLLTANVPKFNSRNFGLGFSAGPVFDVSSGKADTSRFGFFGGATARLTPWLFLTPGFHFGEFADFPQGFDRPGQVIPANTGTPTPNKRYTARFAFAVTYKLRDLGAPTGGSN